MMADEVLVDNDVALKACCYDANEELLECLAGETRSVCVLGVAKYVLPNAIAKGRVADKARASDRLARFLEDVTSLEPIDDELDLAAELEEAALRVSAGTLDVGESQLLAILIRRGAMLLVTGDKRAIRAIEQVVVSHGYEGKAGSRIACLEQAMLSLLIKHGADALHSRVCSEAEMDKALAICFKCVSGLYGLEAIRDSLLSYIRDVRKYTPVTLVESDDLSAVIS
jgi:hypothetical protein